MARVDFRIPRWMAEFVETKRETIAFAVYNWVLRRPECKGVRLASLEIFSITYIQRFASHQEKIRGFLKFCHAGIPPLALIAHPCKPVKLARMGNPPKNNLGRLLV